MNKTALIYSFNTKKTGKIAERIKEEVGDDNLHVLNAEEITEESFLSFDQFILGVPTWFDGELPNYWDEFVPALEDMDLKGKKFALFGLGTRRAILKTSWMVWELWQRSWKGRGQAWWDLPPPKVMSSKVPGPPGRTSLPDWPSITKIRDP
jgi:hypothetical protein